MPLHAAGGRGGVLRGRGPGVAGLAVAACVLAVLGVASPASGSAVTAGAGSVLSWGYNVFGQLGDGNTANSSLPVKVKLPDGTRVTAIAPGGLHGLALTSAGLVLAWGYNGFGQPGDGRTASSDVPVQVNLPDGTRVTAIAGGAYHSLALTSAGAVLAWGADIAGQLGDGKTASSDVPVKVKLPNGLTVTAVRAGSTASWSAAMVTASAAAPQRTSPARSTATPANAPRSFPAARGVSTP